MVEENESRINAMEMRSLRSMCGLTQKDRCRNSDVRERCGLKKDVVTRVERVGSLSAGIRISVRFRITTRIERTFSIVHRLVIDSLFVSADSESSFLRRDRKRRRSLAVPGGPLGGPATSDPAPTAGR
ncbi:hypothetical protein EVAR_8344_1 [Eumeta japonica]|uniref:Uncharacterized protein n=1 Tax=Eumeta variegata TaxID=151549 RepID=A0A4C1VCD5_EUMVA|nr:hypothetical protein EVAR_8344_1 [Eumeta japonica]